MAAKTYVIDASVAIKWFADERDSQSAILLRKSHSQGSVALIAPDLILYEVSNGLRFNKIFSCEDIDAGIASMMSIRIRFYPPKKNFFGRR